MNGTKEMELVPVGETGMVQMLERLALSPDVPVDKLEKLIELQERIMRHNAKAEFDGAFAVMQGQIPIITEDGKILVNGALRSKYATNEAIQETVKPILQQHGFSLRFRNEHLDGNRLKVIGILSHRAGHSEQDEFVCPPDTSGSKNDIQAIGSTRAYGQRYTTLALLNIATRGTDDDGRKSGAKPQPKAPDGFEDWLMDLQATADNGYASLEKTWKASKKEFREHLMSIDAQEIERLKVRAKQVGA